jgi:hypothetical protein
VQFHATGDFGSGDVQDLTSAPIIKWSSSNTAVANKPSAGKTTTAAAGTTTIGAQFGSTPASTNLTVSAAKLSSISITTPLTKLGEGTTMQLRATGKFSDGTTQDITSAATWKSSAAAISVSSSGFVTASIPGSATVTATLDGVSASTPSLQVNAVTIKSVTITPASANIAPGTTQAFKATATFGDNTQQDVTNLVQWSSSDASAATVQDFGTNAGVATALAPGTSNISAVFGSVNASTSSLTVNNATPSGLTITPANPNLALGTSQQLTATMTVNGSPVQDVTQVVTWSSSAIATAVVTRSGLVVSAGTNGGTPATITATFNIPGGSTVSGSTTVTVH